MERRAARMPRTAGATTPDHGTPHAATTPAPLTTGRARTAATAALLTAGIILALGGCAGATPDPTPSDEPAGDVLGIATFEVAGEESYRIALITPELLEHAQQLLGGEEVAPIPVGRVVRDGDGGVNAPWTWHIDPTTLEFADFTTEVCDGLPSFVEREEVTSDDYCPWIAKVTAVELAD